MTSAAPDRILDAATALLERGRVGFTYDALAREAQVSRQTLYTHFPSRGDLLVAVADRARRRLDADRLSRPIFEAPTATDALQALVAFHVAFTPRMLSAYRAVELERALDPSMEATFDQRSAGRRQIVRHVVTRLHAEGVLDPAWTVDSASDFVAAAVNASVTQELLDVRCWTLDELRERLLVVFRRALLRPPPESGTPPRPTRSRPRQPAPSRPRT